MLKKLIFTLTSLSLAHAGHAQQHHYRVTIDQNSNKALVEARINLEGNSLSLFNTNPMPQHPNGQADFLEDIEIRDSQGNPIAFQNKGEGEFELKGNQKVTLRYKVRLEHDKLNWPAGNEEVLYHTKEGLMLSGYTLFLVPAEKMSGETEVEFVLPKNWQARTALQSKDSALKFTAKTRRELVNNAYFFGTAKSSRIEAGGMKIEIVLGDRYWKQRVVIEDLLKAQLSSYQKMFGAKPKSDRYLIIINQGDSGDGGAFSGSFSQYLRADAEIRTRSIWGRVLAHELLHFWNGLSLVPSSDQEEWFKEGVTDYLTIKTLSKNKIIDRDYLFQWLTNLSRGQVVARRAQNITSSVRDAAKNKHQNWLLVYGGGSIAGLALDTEIDKQTQGKYGLEDLIRKLHNDYALQGKTYSLADITTTAQQLTGQDMSQLLSRLVEETNPVDLKPLFQDLALQLEDYMLLEHFLLSEPKATKEQKVRFQRIFH